jgi:hypothetical protein
MTNRRTLLFLAIGFSALVQARLLPEVGLDRLISLPLLLLLFLASAQRRGTLVAAAFLAGLLIDTLLWRPLGLTAVMLVVAVLVSATVRGGGDAGWIRRSVAAVAGYLAAGLTFSVTSGLTGAGGGAQGTDDLSRLALNVGLLVFGSVLGARRRAQQLRERPLDDRLG